MGPGNGECQCEQRDLVDEVLFQASLCINNNYKLPVVSSVGGAEQRTHATGLCYGADLSW
jgi:hypothetical protein